MRVSFSSLLVAGLALLGLPVAGQSLPSLPSGLVPELMEEFVEVKPDGMFTYARFRFLLPALGQGDVPSFDVLADDFMTLCQDYAVPRLKGNPQTIDRVMISYADKPIEFGVSDTGVVQYFEQFSLQDDVCIWEQF